MIPQKEEIYDQGIPFVETRWRPMEDRVYELTKKVIDGLSMTFFRTFVRLRMI
jgi:hypothetical protein